MRCPKCGYNSFDYLDSCKKCGKDLVEHKQRFGIVSVLFPGQMKPQEAEAPLAEEASLEEAVAVATAAAAPVDAPAIEEEEVVAPVPPPSEEASEGDDFGFDFMGDSEEEEDLSFDELFEEAPSEEDVEETLPSPEKDTDNEFAFDVDEAESDADSELESDFGFDPTPEDEEESTDLSFEPDEVSFETDEEEGAEEDPKDPFDLPESASAEQAPESTNEFYFQSQGAEEILADVEAELSADSALDGIAEEPEPIAELPPLEGPEGLAEEIESPLEPSVPETDAAAAVVSFADLQSKVAATVEPAKEAEAFEFGETSADSVEAVAAEEQSDTSVIEEPEMVFTEEVPAAVVSSLPATGSRVLAFACDLALLFLVGISFLFAAEAAISPSGGLLPSTESLIDLSIPYFLVLFSLAFGYFTLFHFLAGQTPGKMLAGLRVETLSGDPLLFSQAFLRSVGGLLQLLPIGLGYLAVLASPEKRGWNDQLAGTRLISLKGALDEV